MKTERDELIREATEAGMTRRAIAEDLGISYSLVQRVVEKKSAETADA